MVLASNMNTLCTNPKSTGIDTHHSQCTKDETFYKDFLAYGNVLHSETDTMSDQMKELRRKNLLFPLSNGNFATPPPPMMRPIIRH